MAENHPIQVSEELIEQWWNSSEKDCSFDERGAFTLAAQWGADQELEACCNWLGRLVRTDESRQLRAARRPKPTSKKEQALAAVHRLLRDYYGDPNDAEIIRRALEALPND